MNEITLSGYVPGAIGRITELHATYYSENWGFGLFFESKVATDLSAFLRRFDANRDGFWLAMSDQKVVGSIAIDGLKSDREGAHLRWFILERECQGSGFGQVLLLEAINFCQNANFKRIYLWTFEGLNTARHLYEKNGFCMCREQADTQWGVTVNEQMFELLLG
jgi:GNAT superfamily N-acetyltransferase